MTQNSNGKCVIIDNYSNRPSNISYFIFRSNINHYLVDRRVLDNLFSYEFSLHLSQILIPSHYSTLPFSISVHNPSILFTYQLVDTFDANISNLPEEKISSMVAAQLRKILSDRREDFPNSRSLAASDFRTLHFPTPTTISTTITTTSTTKMGRLCFFLPLT